MTNFVIAYLNLHDGELLQTIVVAESRLDALVKFLKLEDGIEYSSEEEVYHAVAQWDAYISIIEI